MVYKPVDAVKYELLHQLSFGHKISESTIGELPPSSRIVTDLDVPFGFTLSDAGVRTPAGQGFLLTRESPVDRLIDDVRDRVSDMYLDPPVVWTTREELIGVRLVGHRNMDCDLKTPWINLQRKVFETSNGVAASDRVEILKSIIPNEELRKPEFEKFQVQVRECFYRAAVIFNPVK